MVRIVWLQRRCSTEKVRSENFARLTEIVAVGL